MKLKLSFISCLAMAMAACSGNHSSQSTDSSAKASSTADTTASAAKPANADFCFYSTDGTANQDTTKVALHVNGDKVTGEMNWLPKEKDARKGTLTGNIKGNFIAATWSYGQEGTTDTLGVEFQLKNGQLTQKPYKYDSKTGKQQTDNTAGYTVIYKACK